MSTDWPAMRARFPVFERHAYLNAGTFGPLARTTFDLIEWLDNARQPSAVAGPDQRGTADTRPNDRGHTRTGRPHR